MKPADRRWSGSNATSTGYVTARWRGASGCSLQFPQCVEQRAAYEDTPPTWSTCGDAVEHRDHWLVVDTHHQPRRDAATITSLAIAGRIRSSGSAERAVLVGHSSPIRPMRLVLLSAPKNQIVPGNSSTGTWVRVPSIWGRRR